MQPKVNRIDPNLITGVGGDWGGYGELTGPQILKLLQDDKIRLVLGDKAILVDLTRQDGVHGTYTLKHEPTTNF